MDNSHAKKVRDLSIAMIFLSIFLIVLDVSWAAMAFTGDYGFIFRWLEGAGSGATRVVELLMRNDLSGLIFSALGAAASLVIAILILRSRTDPSRLKTQFVLSIVGAVIAFLGTSILLAILFVILAVYSYSDYKNMKSGRMLEDGSEIGKREEER